MHSATPRAECAAEKLDVDFGMLTIAIVVRGCEIIPILGENTIERAGDSGRAHACDPATKAELTFGLHRASATRQPGEQGLHHVTLPIDLAALGVHCCMVLCPTGDAPITVLDCPVGVESVDEAWRFSK